MKYYKNIFLYRFLIGGKWYKYSVSLAGNYSWKKYWSQDNLINICNRTDGRLKQIKTRNYDKWYKLGIF